MHGLGPLKVIASFFPQPPPPWDRALVYFHIVVLCKCSTITDCDHCNHIAIKQFCIAGDKSKEIPNDKHEKVISTKTFQNDSSRQNDKHHYKHKAVIPKHFSLGNGGNARFR